MKNTIFRILFRRQRASTLIEAITASIILMIVFVIAMDTMTRVMSVDNSSKELMVEFDLKRCQKLLASQELSPSEKVIPKSWGEVHVKVTAYKASVYQVSLIAVNKKEEPINSYCYLQSNP